MRALVSLLVGAALTPSTGLADDLPEGELRDPQAFGEVSPGGESSALAERIPGWMEAYGVPGLNVLVLRGGEVAWAASYGWADPAAGRPMTLDAVFRVESISKPVTAWGVAALWEAGAIDLDEPIQRQLQGWSPLPGTPPITPRQLLSHTAGVGLGDYAARYDPGGPRPTLLESLDSEWTLVGPPSERFSYSDTGYNLLELLIQEAAEEDFGAWMEEHVLGPLGMTDATFDWDPSFAGRIPVGHDLRGRAVEPYVYPGRGSGGLLATVHDVGRFAQAGMASGRAEAVREGSRRTTDVLSPSSIRLLHAPVARPSGLYGWVADGYGLGHFTEVLSDGRQAVWHGGQGFGWMTHLHLVPETGDAIVLLSNSQRAWPLFAHVLRRWSEGLGVEPVGMSRITWARPLAWMIIALCLAVGAVLGARAVARRRSLAGTPGLTPPSRIARVLALVVGIALAGLVAWASVQDYLFLFSILPVTTRWLGLAVATLSLGLLGWALVPESQARRDRRPTPMDEPARR